MTSAKSCHRAVVRGSGSLRPKVGLPQIRGHFMARYEVLSEHAVVVVRLAGNVTPDQIQQGRAALQRDPAFRPTFRQLVDAREVETTRLDTETVQKLSQGSAFKAGSLRAIVAPRDAVYGMARMFEAYAESCQQRVQVFRDLAEACAWLEVPLEDVEAAVKRLT